MAFTLVPRAPYPEDPRIVAGTDGTDFYFVAVDSSGRLVTRNEVWDVDTLQWVSMTQPGGGAGSEISIPKYFISDVDDASTPKYYGFLTTAGNWYIMKEESNTFRYVAGVGGYPTAWTDRAAQTYDYYSEVF